MISRNGNKSKLKLYLLLGFSCSAISCGGEVNFSGGGKEGIPFFSSSKKDETSDVVQGPKTDDATKANENIENPGKVVTSDPEVKLPPVKVPLTRNLAWLWPCEGQELTPPEGITTIEGAGDFVIETDGISPVTLNIQGGVCPPASTHRDISIVVDVSESMFSRFLGIPRGNDPLRNRSCGRLRAAQAVVDSLNKDDRVSLVTFDSGVRSSTSYLSAEDFKKSSFLSSDVLCYPGTNTNYGAALKRVETILEDSRKHSFKEIYFISDGESASGQPEAARIRSVATIATLMLKGDDASLKANIASKDANGAPMHRKVSEAEQLADALKTLSVSNLISGGFAVSYGENIEQEIDLNLSNGAIFDLDPMIIDPALYPNGLEFSTEFVDSLGRSYGGASTIKWDIK